MGRVSKHKKIKSCDPFYKGPRRTHVKKGDLAPSNEDEQLPPRALLRLFKPVGKPKKNESKEVGPKKHGATAKNARKTRTPKHDPSRSEEGENGGCSREGSSLKGRSAMFVRRPGETRRAYLERIDMESQMKISECLMKNRTSERRKRCVKPRPEPRQVITEEDLFKDFDDFKDEVKFGEVVKAPPKLIVKPRGSQFIKNAKRNSSLQLASSSLCEPKPVAGLKHEQDVEDERVRVILAYRLAKKIKTHKTLC